MAGGLARSGLSLAARTGLLDRSPAMTGLGLLDLLRAGTTAANPNLTTAQKALGTAGSALTGASRLGAPIPGVTVGGIPVVGPAFTLASILAGEGGDKGKQVLRAIADFIPSAMIGSADAAIAASVAAAMETGAFASSGALAGGMGGGLGGGLATAGLASLPAIYLMMAQAGWFGSVDESVGEIRARLAS